MTALRLRELVQIFALSSGSLSSVAQCGTCNIPLKWRVYVCMFPCNYVFDFDHKMQVEEYTVFTGSLKKVLMSYGGGSVLRSSFQLVCDVLTV